MGCGSSKVHAGDAPSSQRVPVGVQLSTGLNAGPSQKLEREAQMAAAFREIDTDNDGRLTKQEIREAFAKTEMNVGEEELILLMGRIDVDRGGDISLEEFSRLSALKLHLLAQGLAEEGANEWHAGPRRSLRTSARLRAVASAAWRRVGPRASTGQAAGGKQVVKAMDLVSLFASKQKDVQAPAAASQPTPSSSAAGSGTPADT